MKYNRVAAIIMAISCQVNADSPDSQIDTGSFGFTGIEKSASPENWQPEAPWLIPEGYVQRIVSDENDLNIYDRGRDDWNDMLTVNETGPEAGRFLYRTHEVRNRAEGAAVSVVDLNTGVARILVQDASYVALDGIRWTPWGTLLIAEEKTGGRLFEISLVEGDPGVAAAVLERPALGRLAHEGIEIGADGSVYLVDEFLGQYRGYGGGIYRFVPDEYGDLSTGKLYVLKVTGGEDGTGQGEWVGPIDPANARRSGTEFGGTGYNRPEDLEIIGSTLYVAITEGPLNFFRRQRFDCRVLAVDLLDLSVSNFVIPGVNVSLESGRPGDTDYQTGFDHPDNLAETPDGRLMIIEDNMPSDIWVADKDRNNDGYADAVELFASLSDPGAEGTGIYFGKDPYTLFVNVQHSAADDGDATWAISKRREAHAVEHRVGDESYPVRSTSQGGTGE